MSLKSEFRPPAPITLTDVLGFLAVIVYCAFLLTGMLCIISLMFTAPPVCNKKLVCQKVIK